MTDILAVNPNLTAFTSTGAFTRWYDNAYRRAVEQVNDNRVERLWRREG